jgi:hypothetical protein
MTTKTWSPYVIVPPFAFLLAAFAVVVGKAPAAPLAPASIRIEVQYTNWSSGFWHGEQSTDTLFLQARPGDSLLPPGRRSKSPRFLFGLGSIVDPHHAWVRLGRWLYPSADALYDRWHHCEVMAWDDTLTACDSILVSTTWRRLSSRSRDAGVDVAVRIIDDAQGPTVPFPHARVVSKSQRRVGTSEFETWAGGAEVIGVFDLQQISEGDSTGMPPYRRRNIWLAFVAREVWRGGSIRPGERVVVSVPGSRTDTTWSIDPRATPMRTGRPVVLFLDRKNPDEAWQFGWGYGLFDDSARLLFGFRLRGIPIERFHDAVNAATWHLDHPYEARVVGSVRLESGAAPGMRLDVSFGGDERVVKADTTGGFEIRGAPFGPGRLTIPGPGGRASARIEADDEMLDTLQVIVPDDLVRRR